MKRIILTFSLSLSLCQAALSERVQAAEHTSPNKPARVLVAARGSALDARQRSQINLPTERHAKRIGEVEVLLPAATKRGARHDLPLVGERVEMDLFADERFTALGREVREGIDGARTWIADIEGGGLVTLTRNLHGETYGTVERLPHIYNLQQGRNGKLYASDIDQRLLPEDGLDDVVDFSYKSGPATLSTAKSGGSTIIDVLIVYTPRVAQRFTPVLLAENGMANLNAAMQYAGLDVTMNLVGLEQVAYVEPAEVEDALDHLAGGAERPYPSA